MIAVEKNGKIILEGTIPRFRTGQLVMYMPLVHEAQLVFDGYGFPGHPGPVDDIGLVVEVSRKKENEGIIHPDCHYCRVVWQKEGTQGIYFEDELYAYAAK